MAARGEGTVREFGMDMYTLLYLKWITNKDLLYIMDSVGEGEGGKIWQSILKQDWLFFAGKDGEALYSQQKQARELTVAQFMTLYCKIQT